MKPTLPSMGFWSSPNTIVISFFAFRSFSWGMHQVDKENKIWQSDLISLHIISRVCYFQWLWLTNLKNHAAHLLPFIMSLKFFFQVFGWVQLGDISLCWFQWLLIYLKWILVALIIGTCLWSRELFLRGNFWIVFIGV